MFSFTTLLLLVSAVLLICSILKRVSGRLGIPSLLAFILLGMIFGSDGIFKIHFENYEFSKQISTLALVFIIFYGGFGTNWKEAKPAAAASILLSSLGTVMTALLTGLFCHLFLRMDILEGMLCGALLSSTDAASVFSILRSRNLALKENTAPLLEVESGSNDPVAYTLTIILLTAMGSSVTFSDAGILLLKQLVIGALFGFTIGLIVRWTLQKHPFEGSGIETIFIVAVALFGYAMPTVLDGNGFLSVYITGIILGNSILPEKTILVPFFDGVTSILQAILFFLLGLLSFPSEMVNVWLPALAIALFLTFIARPVAVFLLLTPFRGSIRKSLLVSFAGLRGAASIVFAIITVLSPISTENDLFHIAFVVVLFSIALQGSLLPLISNKLNMIDKEGNVFKTFTDYVDETPINFIQFAITKNHEWCDKCVSELTLPPGSILVNLQRGETQLVPKGDTRLLDGDLLVMCSMECKQVPDLFLTEKLIEKNDLHADSTLADVSGHSTSLIIMIQRGEEYLIPDGATVLKEGDRLIIHRQVS